MLDPKKENTMYNDKIAVFPKFSGVTQAQAIAISLQLDYATAKK